MSFSNGSVSRFTRVGRARIDTFLLGLLAAFLGVNMPSYAANVNVFAAASLSDSIKAIAQGYQKRSGDKIVLNLGASSTLARQIQEGAPADIFFSADEDMMNRLQRNGLIEGTTRRSRLSNTLVIIVAAKDGAIISSPQDLTNSSIKRLALGDPKIVPIGVYAKQYLQKVDLWPEVESKVIPMENVRAALAAVEAGDADASIVYKTDASISKAVRVAYSVPIQVGPKVSYPMALVKGGKEPVAARKFFDYLQSGDAEKVFEQYGFILIGDHTTP
jgi:molybdate transport system substrate-binding protein